MSKRNGRPPTEITYKDISLNGKEYIVGCFYTQNDEKVTFTFDKEDEDKVKGHSWHKTSNYIAYNVKVDGKQKAMYLHNLIMYRLGFHGKGQTESVDHINRIGFDNRKENLHVVSQTEQNINQNKRGRPRIALPDDSGLTPEEIPKHIWYVKANGKHGDRFAIEFKSEGLLWRTTSSKAVSLRDKLESAKQKLQEYYTLYPHLNPSYINTEVKELTDSYHLLVNATPQI
jgi:hypothetical protein